MTQVTASSDVWSVGCLIVELLTGYPPYYDLQPMSALFRIVQDDHPPLPDDCSALMADFLLLCFQKVWRGGGEGGKGGERTCGRNLLYFQKAGDRKGARWWGVVCSSSCHDVPPFTRISQCLTSKPHPKPGALTPLMPLPGPQAAAGPTQLAAA